MTIYKYNHVFAIYQTKKNIFFLFFSNFPIDLFFTLIYYSKHHAGVAKLVIALACHAGDHGFEPRHSRLTFQHDGRFFYRAIAQLVARDVRDVEVAGSNPVCPTFSNQYVIGHQ